MSRRKSAQHREMWTEEEVMEFGLAGEEEYCDMQVMEEIELSPPSVNSSMAPVDITKSGRVQYSLIYYFCANVTLLSCLTLSLPAYHCREWKY